MKHHRYKSEYKFVREPIGFNKYTPKEALQYALGATMYMPGTKDFTEKILDDSVKGLTSIALCFEDACKEEDVPKAEENVLYLLSKVADALENNEMSYDNIPLIFCRVRNVEQFKHFSAKLEKRHLKILTGINFPKFSTDNAEAYYSHLKLLNEKFGEILYGMPIIEDSRVAAIETRVEELMGIKEVLDRYRDLVLQIRVGGTDFSGYFGVRRGVNHSIYDIMTVSNCLSDILNVFTRNNDYTVSGPVWEYFRVTKEMKFKEIPHHDMNDFLLKRTTIYNPEADSLIREIILDKANGFVGRTVIHPSHLRYVNALMAVTKEEFDDAEQILKTKSGVIKSLSQNKMNEIGPHRSWAEKTYNRAMIYGVIADEREYLNLFSE